MDDFALRLMTYFLLKNPFRGVGCSELQEPKKALKSSHPRWYG